MAWVKERPRYLLEVFKQHNDQLKQLIGTDCSKATFGKYRTTYDHTANVINWKYQADDLDITRVTIINGHTR